MLTHANVMFQVDTVPITVGCTDRVLSILPVWHIFERVFEMLAIACGSCTYYSSIRTFGEDLKQVEPTFMGSAPRLWENLHDRILKGVRASHPVRRALFHTAYYLAHQYQESVFALRGQSLALQPVSRFWKVARWLGHGLRWAILLPAHGLFNAAVLERVRQAVGGSLKATVSGGGALPVEIDRFFNYIGIPVLEGYGLTETAPVLAVRTESSPVVGTVGPPLAKTEIRIVDLETGETRYPNPELATGGRGQRGEIWVRGPQVMKGYYRDPETTARALRNGWLRTGDLGMITFNDCLKILGRCKETIVLISGENLEPGPIEERLRQSPLIEQCMVVGQDRRFIAALIVPKLDGLRELGWSEGGAAELPDNGRANQMVREEIRRIISAAHGFKAFERIHDFRLLHQSFTVGEELTNLGKLKRHVVETKYEGVIREMFEPTTGKGKTHHGR
jgi:long-chain acyl-CoA synthetase